MEVWVRGWARAGAAGLAILIVALPATNAGHPAAAAGTTAAVTPAATPVTPAATTQASTAQAAATAERRLAVWNHDVELGTDNAAPAHWSASPATPRAALKAVRKGAPRPFPSYTGDKTINHVVWIYDKTRSGGAAARSRALNATPGRTYTTYAQVYVGSGTSARLNLEFLNASGRRLRLADQANRLPKAGVITFVKATGVAPAGTTAVRATIVSSYAAVGSSYWDTVYVAEVPRAPGYAAGLGTGPVLFVDSHRIESSTGLTRVLHQGEKYRAGWDSRAATPVYDSVCCHRDGQPPHSSQMFGTVLYEDGVYKMWYTAKASGLPWSVRYAESEDGRSFPSGRQVLSGVWAGGVVRNPNPADTARKYLMLGVKGTIPTATRIPMPPVDVTYRAYASPDGYHWTPMSSSAVLPMRDVASVSYDEVTRRFVAATKQASGGNRQQYVSYSTDFVNWTSPRQALRTDPGDPANASIYGASVFRYGDQLLGLPLVYTQGVVNGVNGPIVPQLAASTDGLSWSRPVRTPLVPLGASGELDDGFILTSNAPVVTANRIRLYYSAWDAGHEAATRNSRIFYAEWRRDGFVSLRAGSSGGTLTTTALQPSGDELTVNADLGGGTLRAEVRDATTNAVIPGYGAANSTVVTGDTLAGTLRWGGKKIGTLGARRIKIRFAVSAGDFYSFRIT